MAKQGNDGTRGHTFDSQIMPRLEIKIPMPPGAAIPARAPQSQPAPPQAEPARPAAALPS
jgi:hypothetical protein